MPNTNYIKSRRCPSGKDDPHKPYHPTKGFRRVCEKRLQHGWKHPLLRQLLQKLETHKIY